jgi:hypothetical protein
VNWKTCKHIRDINAPVVDCSGILPQRDRVMINKKETRQYMVWFCTGRYEGKNLLMEQVHFINLLTLLDDDCSVMATFLRYLYSREQEMQHPRKVVNHSFPSSWKRLLIACTANNSLSWFVRPEMVPLVEELTTGNL